MSRFDALTKEDFEALDALIERMKTPQEPQPWVVGSEEYKRMVEALEPRRRFTDGH